MKKSVKGALIGGIIGLVLGVLFNIRGTIIYEQKSYSYTFNLIALIGYILLGLIFGMIYSYKKRVILNTIILSIFFGGLLFFNTFIWESYTLGKIIFNVLNPPFTEFIKSELALFGVILSVIWWVVIGIILGWIIKKIILRN